MSKGRKEIFSLERMVNSLLVLIAFTFPFYALINSYLIGALLLITIISLLSKKLVLERPHFYFYLFISLYVINIIGLIYSSNTSLGLKSLETKASILIFPLVFIATKSLKVDLGRILKAFVYGVVLATAICIFYALWRQYKFNQFESINWYFFSYRDLTSILDIHPIYLAFFVSFSGFVTIFQIIKAYREKEFLKSGSYLLLYVYLLILLLLLSSRINIVGHILLIFSLSAFIGFKTKKWKAVLGGVVLITVLVILLLSVSKVTKERLFEAFNIKQHTEYINQWGDNSLEIRLIKWRSALDIIKNNWLIGVGTGDAQNELIKEYKKFDFEAGIDRGYNVHNEYLEYFLSFGVIGIVLLLTSLCIPIYKSLKESNILYFSFLFLFCFFAITESVLQVQKGVVPFSFFNSLFFFGTYNENQFVFKK